MKLLAALIALTVTVAPGQSWTNLDGVRVRVRPASTGTVKLTGPVSPGGLTPWGSGSTTARFLPGSKADCLGLDWFDFAYVSAGATAHIVGMPHEVTLEAGSKALIRCEMPTWPAGFPQHALLPAPIRVNLPNGSVSILQPGQSWYFTP